MRWILCTVMGLGVTLGCNTDVAKVIEAKSMAVCACEKLKCLKAVNEQFESKDINPYGQKLTKEQKTRIALAKDKEKRCLANIKP